MVMVSPSMVYEARGDGEHVVFGGNEVIGLGGGDGMVGLVDVLIIGLVGAGADGEGVSLRYHIGVSFHLFPLDTYKIPRYGKPYIQKRSTTRHRHKMPTPSINQPSRPASRAIRLARRLVFSPVPVSSRLISSIVPVAGRGGHRGWFLSQRAV